MRDPRLHGLAVSAQRTVLLAAWFYKSGYDVLLYTLPFHGRRAEQDEFDSLMTGLASQVFGVYGNDTVVYPGHSDGRGAARAGGVARAGLVTL